MLEETISRADCDAVVVATPVDLTRFFAIARPAVRVRYELEERGTLGRLDRVRAWPVIRPFTAGCC